MSGGLRPSSRSFVAVGVLKHLVKPHPEHPGDLEGHLQRRGTLEHPANPGSKGCGAVMRSAPFGLVRPGLEDTWQMAAECAVFTHGHPSGYLAAAAFAWTIGEIVDGRGIADVNALSLSGVTNNPAGFA
jgi:ADP-ribosylglycohydrolase